MNEKLLKNIEKNFVVFFVKSIMTFVSDKGHEEHKVNTKDTTFIDNLRTKPYLIQTVSLV